MARTSLFHGVTCSSFIQSPAMMHLRSDVVEPGVSRVSFSVGASWQSSYNLIPQAHGESFDRCASQIGQWTNFSLRIRSHSLHSNLLSRIAVDI